MKDHKKCVKTCVDRVRANGRIVYLAACVMAKALEFGIHRKPRKAKEDGK